NLIFDVHLMLQDADKFIDEFAEAGSDIITVHQEAVPNLKETLKNIHSFGKKAGVSLKPGTPVDMILNVLDLTDVVLLMTVEPGFGGQSYLHQVDKKISELYKIINNQNLNIGIEVDGGITEENVNRPVRAGANIIVSGSAIFNSNNIKDTINKMRKKAEQGVQEREINNF
ncbi:MAG: ribulose-phosphate 3-epimerase, partial [Monoglobus pectinilyticus]